MLSHQRVNDFLTPNLNDITCLPMSERNEVKSSKLFIVVVIISIIYDNMFDFTDLLLRSVL